MRHLASEIKYESAKPIIFGTEYRKHPKCANCHWISPPHSGYNLFELGIGSSAILECKTQISSNQSADDIERCKKPRDFLSFILFRV